MKICIISENNICYDEHTYNRTSFTKDKILDLVDDYCQFINVNDKEIYIVYV